MAASEIAPAIEPVADFGGEKPSPGMGLCLSGDGCRAMFVSDGSLKFSPEPDPAGEWLCHSKHVMDLLFNQVSSLRKRLLISSYEAACERGATGVLRQILTITIFRPPCPVHSSARLNLLRYQRGWQICRMKLRNASSTVAMPFVMQDYGATSNQASHRLLAFPMHGACEGSVEGPSGARNIRMRRSYLRRANSCHQCPVRTTVTC